MSVVPSKAAAADPALQALIALIDDAWLASCLAQDYRSVGEVCIDAITSPAAGEIVRGAGIEVRS